MATPSLSDITFSLQICGLVYKLVNPYGIRAATSFLTKRAYVFLSILLRGNRSNGDRYRMAAYFAPSPSRNVMDEQVARSLAIDQMLT
ncbi:predicted protein [Plenodomus lingam JN3]|uniref:Predicted protein n=1 Tax=Leptosphaeria maculans (strain JN3 / isolate v23.1.3 / race Av1-4-5-6-7-8) TaxID=985895 RepID=E5A5G9_LEPMJ|nr:predicted protein [Plenodomus lingam JN3]CBX98867.1 predicted protein [Plenodomus lingam JN3]